MSYKIIKENDEFVVRTCKYKMALKIVRLISHELGCYVGVFLKYFPVVFCMR